MNQYIPDETYERLVEALLARNVCPITGKPDPAVVREVLGEVGGIWPSSIKSPDGTRLSLGSD